MCNLLDLHGNPLLQLAPETYFRGPQRLDYILGSINIAQAVTRSGILAYKNGLKYSDHRAVFVVDLAEYLLFSEKGTDTTNPRACGLCTQNTKQETSRGVLSSA